MTKQKQKFYTVWVGRVPGVYHTWEECKEQVFQFEGAVYKSFRTLAEAESAFQKVSEDFIGNEKSSISKDFSQVSNPPEENTICVDGAWNTRTNAMEYQGVMFPQMKRIFHAGPFPTGTNNIAEFLAIVHALTYCKTHPEISIIYSDSNTAITWVKNKKAKTKIAVTNSNTTIISIVKRAEDWLLKNIYTTKINKWETSEWGENPADFGRK
ncbi:ribonuclease H1 domain-containing protein [Pedobacter endophyticus]|uniref:Ribonuclease H n=1 Tax=Pedobacter endophyticus TaxID=2789740 RepID=A0A7U3Q3V7_9SPHI|nr:ribonuclease H family protein [Pedobacter endophyticus]QPH37889.1 ribonuclease H family protein [Pedobacter endophyticus]